MNIEEFAHGAYEAGFRKGVDKAAEAVWSHAARLRTQAGLLHRNGDLDADRIAETIAKSGTAKKEAA